MQTYSSLRFSPESGVIFSEELGGEFRAFILTDKPKEAGDLLVSMGLEESFSRDHKGQGTSNRRFGFSNGMLEILYVRDSEESNNGPAKNLRFSERIQTENGKRSINPI
tara:strand:+ start:15648 stop:15974 length:327 start_codon:yes stop_codon:yes gene_type:complete